MAASWPTAMAPSRLVATRLMPASLALAADWGKLYALRSHLWCCTETETGYMTDPKDMLRTLYRSSPTAVVVTDEARQLTGLNPAAERLFGYLESELIGASAQALYADPRDFAELGETYFNREATDSSRSYTARYRAKSGRVFDGETVASAVISPAGKLDGFVCIIRDVTAELSLQAKLEASDIQLRVALSSANEGTFSLNLVSGLGSTRGFINEFLGIKSADATISRARWTDALHEDDRAEFDSAFEQLIKRPASQLDIVYRARRTDGAWRWLQTRGRVSEFGRDGQALRISGTIADVTDRRELEIQLAVREEQLENAIAGGSSGIWEMDPASPGILAVGPIRAMLGLTDQPERIDQALWLDQIHLDDREKVTALIEKWMREEIALIDIEYRIRDRRTNEWVWLRSRGQTIDRDPKRSVLAGVLIDISGQKKLEERLAQSEQLVREALDSVKSGAWSVDLARGTIRASGFLADLIFSGKRNEEISLESWSSHFPAEDRAVIAERLAGAARTRLPGEQAGEVKISDYRILDKNGETLWVRSRGRVIEWDENGQPLRAAGTHTNISEEKRLESELADRDLQFREALKATNEGAWRVNLKTRLIDVSGVISEMLGLPPNDARVAISDIIDRFDSTGQAFANKALQAMAADQIQEVDFTARIRSEKDGWISIHNRGRITERDSQGRPTVALGFMSDISEQLQAREVLMEREQQLTDAIQATSLGIFRIDVDRAELWLRGNVAEELFESGAEVRLPTQTWLERVHPKDLQRVTDLTTAMFQGTKPVGEIDYRMLNRMGDWTWYQVTGRVVDTDANGRVRNISGVVWNIDAQKRLNDALLDERHRYEAIYRATPAMMHTIDANGTIREASDYWLSHMGYSREEVVGRKSIDFLDPESRQRAIEKSLPELFRAGHNTDIPYRFVRKDGSKLDVLLSSFLERDADGAPLQSYAVINDVTQLRAAYAQLERTNAELDRFATVASHDLQEPLRKVAAFAGLIRRRYTSQLDEDGNRSLDYLVDAAQRMQCLIDDLLAYSRMSSQSLALQSVDLRALMADVSDQLGASISECGAHLEIDQLPTVCADPLLMRQVLQNLVSNALKYRGADPPQIAITAHRDDEAWTISVTDNGIGIDPKFFDKIFAPFQRLHSREEYSGTGIGLAIVRQAVERHDGRIWVESTEGKGAKFCFSIPIRPGAEDSETA